MFMTNSMLLWRTLDSVLLPIVIKPKVVTEALQWSGECKCKVMPVKPNWQANEHTMQLLRSCWTILWRTNDLEKTVNMNFLLISLSVTTVADAFLHIKVTSGRMINYPLYDAIHKKTDCTREQPMHPPNISQKPKFIERGFLLGTSQPFSDHVPLTEFFI